MTNEMPWISVGPGKGCDYVTDQKEDDIELNAAMNEVAHTGGIVLVYPHSEYHLSSDDVVVPQHCSLIQLGNTFESFGIVDIGLGGAAFVVESPDIGVVVEAHTKVSGIKFYCPWQAIDSDPIPSVPSIRATSSPCPDVEIDHCNFTNSYIGIGNNFGNTHSNWYINNNVGFPLYRGIDLGRGADTDRIVDNHFIIGYYPKCKSGLARWVRDNGIAFKADFIENSMLRGNFGFEYNTLINIENSYGCDLLQNESDNCRIAMKLVNCYGFTIDSNHPSGHAIRGGGNFFDSVSESCMVGNYVHGAEGAFFRNCKKIQFVANRVHDATYHGAYFENCQHITCGKNTISGDGVNTYQGIAFDGHCHHFNCGDNEISGIKKGGQSAMIASGADVYTVHDNIGNVNFYFGNVPSCTRKQRDNIVG